MVFLYTHTHKVFSLEGVFSDLKICPRPNCIEKATILKITYVPLGKA